MPDIVKPVIFVDEPTLKKTRVLLRRLLVGLTTESIVPVIVHPSSLDSSSLPSLPVEAIPWSTAKIPGTFVKEERLLVQKLANLKPTVIHAFGSGRAESARKIAQELNLKYILSINEMPRGIKKIRISKDRCFAIIVPNIAVKEQMTRKYPKFADKLRIVPVGAYIEQTCSCFKSMDTIPGIVIAQSIEQAENFEPLLNALKHLTIDGFEFMLAIVGSGKAERQLNKLITKLGLTQNVSMVPESKSLRKIFSGADIYIHLKAESVLNLHLLEAMGVGTAVAASADKKNELLAEDQTAVLFDAADELSIYSALQRLLSKRDFARQIALNAQSNLRKDHTVSKMTANILEIYRQTHQKTEPSTPA